MNEEDKRNTGQEKKKRNKAFPYKTRRKVYKSQRYLVNPLTHEPRWAVVHGDGEVIEKFRSICAAKSMMKYYKERHGRDIKIIELE